MHSLQAAALRYAAKGWPAFLLGRNKRPLANCGLCKDTDPKTHDPQGCRCLTCHGFYAATRDPKAIRRMLAVNPAGMLAIRTGAPSGLVVLDIDPRNGGTESLGVLKSAGLLVPTLYVRTGSGGWHLYYRHPGPHIRIPSGKNRLGPGIDVKADGGYVVAPPSLHPVTRSPYVWADESTALEDMAPALAAACSPDPGRPAAAPLARPTLPPRSGGAISHPAKLMATLLDRIHAAPEGRRRTTLYGCARGAALIVAAGHLTATDAYHTLVAACDAAGWTWAKTTPNAIRDGFAAEGVAL